MRRKSIWKLTPLKTNDTVWNSTNYRGIVIVRARNEQDARVCAMRRFGIVVPKILKEKTPVCPWLQGEMVACERLKDSSYDRIGDSMVLERIPTQEIKREV